MGRLSKYQFLVLAALLRRPMHPYAIRDEITQISGDRLWARRSTPFTITPQGRHRVRRELSMYHSVVMQSWNRLEKDDA